MGTDFVSETDVTECSFYVTQFLEVELSVATRRGLVLDVQNLKITGENGAV